MARSNDSLPVFRVSAGTAFKAGFFGAIGFLIAQVIAGTVIALVLVGVMGVSLFGIGSLQRDKIHSIPVNAATETTSTETSSVANALPHRAARN